MGVLLKLPTLQQIGDGRLPIGLTAREAGDEDYLLLAIAVQLVVVTSAAGRENVGHGGREGDEEAVAAAVGLEMLGYGRVHRAQNGESLPPYRAAVRRHSACDSSARLTFRHRRASIAVSVRSGDQSQKEERQHECCNDRMKEMIEEMTAGKHRCGASTNSAPSGATVFSRHFLTNIIIIIIL